MSAGKGRLAVEPRSGTPGGRVGLGEWMGLDASGDENGRENRGSGLDEEEGILGDCGRGCCTEHAGGKCILGAGDSVKSMKSATELLLGLKSLPLDKDVGGEEDDDGALSEEEPGVLSSKTGLEVSARDSDARQLRRERREGDSESSCATAEP